MSKAAFDWARRQIIPDAAMKAVLLQLCYLHADGRDPFPSQKTLSSWTGVSARSVFDAIKLLEHFGVVGRTRRSKGAMGRGTDRFQIALDREFTLTQVAIAASRKHLCKSRTPQVADSAVPTREYREGIEGDQKNPAKKKIGDSQYTTEGEAPGRRTLAVIAGGRS